MKVPKKIRARGADGYLNNATGLAIGSNSGVAISGASGTATAFAERIGAIGGAIVEKTANCARDGGC